MTDRTTATGFG